MSNRVNSINNKAKKAVVAPLVISIIAAEIITALSAVIIAFIVTGVDNYDDFVYISSYFCAGLGAFVGGLLTSMAFRRDKYIMSLVSGIIICIILVVINLLFYKEPITANSLIKYSVIIFSSFIASFLVKTKRRRR